MEDLRDAAVRGNGARRWGSEGLGELVEEVRGRRG